jgi:cytochrome c-type biogenesis protein CcmH
MTKRRLMWALIIVLSIGMLAFGSLRDSGPLTQQDRIDVITKRIACPTCDGESVFVSRAPSAQSIRAEVARQVGDGVRTDDEIVAYIAERFGGEVLLLPRATGLDALVWILPAMVTVVLVAALWLAFRRWRQPVVVATSKRSLLVSFAIACVVGLGGGVLVARQAGQRLPLQTATGGIEDSTASLLAQARLAGPTNVTAAIELYGRVLETDPDNVEAVTYRAWLIMLSARQFDESLRNQAFVSTITALGRAIELDPTYPDAMCFLGIVVYRDGGDAKSAKEFVDRCLERDPPAEVRGLVETLAGELNAELGE